MVKINKATTRFIGITALLIILDQLSKYIFRNTSIDFGFIALTPTRNTGISFGLFQGTTILISVISIIVLAALYYFRKEFKGKEIYVSLISAGIIGNLIDRIVNGYVFDFLNLKWWPVFNLADSFIFIGVILYIISVLAHEKKQKRSR